MTTNIFLSHDAVNTNDVSGKLTYTDIINNIPDGYLNKRNEKLLKNCKCEFRWRFFKLPNDKFSVEISKYYPNNNKRLYFNKFGKWVEDTLDPVYDEFVDKEYYYYVDE